MFTINFYNFSKKENSTALPGAVDLSTSCILKEGSSILNPYIQLDLGVAIAPNYNYAYIPEFERYYWIQEWTFSNGLWSASLSVDVLASWKEYIGNSNLYILRSSYTFNGYVRDTLYPADANFTLTSKTAVLPWSYSSGIYVIGIVTKSADFGSLRYYVLTPAQLKTLVSYLLSDGFFTAEGFQTADGSLILQKCLTDPIQYIKSCTYIPIPRSSLSVQIETAAVTVYDWETEIMAARINENAPVYEFINNEIELDDHPQAAERGKFLNDLPYTERTLYIPPFGAVQLDSSHFIEGGALNLIIRVDLVSGQGELIIANSIGRRTNYLTGMIGVPINLSQVTRDWIGATESIAQNVIAAAINPIQAPSRIVNGVGSVLDAMRPKCQSVSGGGSFAQLANGNTYLESKFAHIVNDDNNQQGRPLCAYGIIKNYPGFIQVQNGDILAPATANELNDIRGYIESGFYYE